MVFIPVPTIAFFLAVMMLPGDVGSEELRVTWYPVDRILAKSAIPLTPGWKNVKWILLKDNKPRALKAE